MIANFAIVPARLLAPTCSTGLPSLTMTISGARCIVPICAIAFIAPNGSSFALGTAGPAGCAPGGAETVTPGGGTTVLPPPFFAAGAGAPGFFRPRRALSSLMSRLVPGRLEESLKMPSVSTDDSMNPLVRRQASWEIRCFPTTERPRSRNRRNVRPHHPLRCCDGRSRSS